MNQITSSEAVAVTEAYRVDATRGTTNSRVSNQWWNRPDDQRFLSLSDLYLHCRDTYETSIQDVIEVKGIKVRAERDDPNSLNLIYPSRNAGHEVITSPTHWSFGQLCGLLSVPAAYLRKLPGTIAGINMQWAVSNFREENIKAYSNRFDAGDALKVGELRAATGPEYGRIPDYEMVGAVQKIAGDGTGDTHWKIPGVLQGLDKYDPFSPVTKRSTTLFASDRDVFMFLVDDTHPIEIGKLPDGSPDLVFRGFYVWNSEVGSKSMGIATFYLRGVCMNRIMWGVEGFEEITLRHSKNAPMRFASEVNPALESFANSRTDRLLTGIKTARDTRVAGTDLGRLDFLSDQGFTKPQSTAIINSVLAEEGHPAESVWDFVQGITAVARDVPYTNERIDMERKASKLLNKVAGPTKSLI